MELGFRYRKSVLIPLVSLFLLPILNGPAADQAIRTGYTSKTLGFFPMFVAQKKGFYDQENIKVQLIQMGGSAVHERALIAGEIQFANINPDGVSLYNEKRGGPVWSLSSVVTIEARNEVALISARQSVQKKNR